MKKQKIKPTAEQVKVLRLEKKEKRLVAASRAEAARKASHEARLKRLEKSVVKKAEVKKQCIEVVQFLYATAPERRAQRQKERMEMLAKRNADAVKAFKEKNPSLADADVVYDAKTNRFKVTSKGTVQDGKLKLDTKETEDERKSSEATA